MPPSFVSTHPAAAEPNSLRYKLHKQIRNTKPGRDLKNLHASDMTKGFCPRERQIINLKEMGPKDEWNQASLQMVYDLGNAVERIVIHHASEACLAYGDWRCDQCNRIHAWCERPTRCNDCDCARLSYHGRRFYSAASGISCGIDLLVRGFGPKLRVVEIKSVQKDDFRKLVAPLAEHKIRTNLYMRIVSESGDPDAQLIDTEQAFVMYVDKGGYGILDGEVAKWKLGDRGYSPFKEFVVKRDDAQTDGMCERAATYRKAIFDKVICAGICVGPTDAPAKSCRVAQDCFSNKFPVGAKY